MKLGGMEKYIGKLTIGIVLFVCLFFIVALGSAGIKLVPFIIGFAAIGYVFYYFLLKYLRKKL